VVPRGPKAFDGLGGKALLILKTKGNTRRSVHQYDTGGPTVIPKCCLWGHFGEIFSLDVETVMQVQGFLLRETRSRT
jgi:hypothetical protein